MSILISIWGCRPFGGNGMDLAGAVVVVTGGTGGLGSRICHAFARGSRVAVVYLERTVEAEALATELVATGARRASPYRPT